MIAESQLGVIVPIPGLARFLAALRARPEPINVCPVCNWTRDQAKQSGLMGCGFCHTIFADIRIELQKLNSLSPSSSNPVN